MNFFNLKKKLNLFSTLILGEGHQIKKSIGSSSQQVHLGVFLSFSDRCQFSVFQPLIADGRYQLHHITTVFGPRVS